MTSNTLLLLDGNSLLNRAYYGLLGRHHLTAPDGTPTGALFAFLNMYLRYVEDIKPAFVAATFDRKEPNFRHRLFTGYKATRKAMPDELAVQLPLLKEVLQNMGVCCLEKIGYEADDLIGTLAAFGKSKQLPVCIVSGDKDSFQLAGDDVIILQPVTKSGKSETERYDAKAVQERFQVTPAQFIDLKAIMGDPSDNIPGVKGIGEKGAIELIVRYGSLDGVYAALDQIRPALADKLRSGREMAYLSQQLATICQSVPLDVNLADLELKPPSTETLTPLLSQLGFKNILAKLNLSAQVPEQQLEPFPLCQVADVKIWQEHLAENPELPALWITNDQSIVWTCDSIQTFCLSTTDTAEFWSILQNSGCRPVVYDYKSLLQTLELSGLTIGVHDVLISAYLLNQIDGKPDLERLYHRVTGQLMQEADPASLSNSPAVPVQPDLFSLLQPEQGGMDHEPSKNKVIGKIDLLGNDAIKVRAIRDIAISQKAQILERQIQYLAYDVEMPLACILSVMEKRGFAVNLSVLESLSEDMGRQLEVLQQKIYEYCGRSFNLNSPRQLGEILYQDLGLATGKKRTGGAFSTDSDELERLSGEHPVIPLIIEHRQTSKLRSTFVDGLKKAIDPKDGRVHTTFNQTLTATGRLSSSDPNLQNIPIRMEAGQQIRRAFIAAPGHVLLDADYSQIELRLLAHLSEDPAMVEAFVQSEDIHLNTACRIFGLPPQKVTPEMRSIAKTMNFSIVYGISDFGLARDLGIPVRHAHRYIAEYEEQYPQVRRYLDQLIEKAYQTGYVETLFGRRRYLVELKSANRNLRQFGERAAMNTPVQGTAADLIKIAMVRVAERFIQMGLKSCLILQVHDELIVESPLEEAEQASKILKDAMENVVRLKVPLVAEVHQGASWADCK